MVFAVEVVVTDVDEDEAVDEVAAVSFAMSVKLRDFFESDPRLPRRATEWCEEEEEDDRSLNFCCLTLPPWRGVFADDFWPSDVEPLLSKICKRSNASSVALLWFTPKNLKMSASSTTSSSSFSPSSSRSPP